MSWLSKERRAAIKEINARLPVINAILRSPGPSHLGAVGLGAAGRVFRAATAAEDVEEAAAEVSAGDTVPRTMIVEYRLAAIFGRVWVRVRPGSRLTLEHTLDWSASVARGEQLPADKLLRVQDFGVLMWWRFLFLSMVLFFPVIGVTAVIRPGRWGAGVAADIIIFCGCLAAVSVTQVIFLRYRSDRTRAFVRRNRLESAEEPLPDGSPGLPRRSDFWLVSSAGMIFFAVLLYAASAHG
jgi:hypothetical protein